MNLPSSFGEFWPDGDFEGTDKDEKEGWRQRLQAYFRDQPEQGQKRLFDYDDSQGNRAHFYPGYVSGKFISEIGTKRGPDRPPFTSIESHEPPSFFETCKTYSSLGSLIMLNSRIIAVDDELKGLIEGIEPGVHGFYPIEIRMPKGAVFPKRYHVLVIGQYFDSFSPDQSKPGSWRKDGDYAFQHGERKADMAGLAFSSAVFGKAHLWRERRRREWITLLSDELKATIEQADLRMPKINKMKEV